MSGLLQLFGVHLKFKVVKCNLNLKNSSIEYFLTVAICILVSHCTNTHIKLPKSFYSFQFWKESRALMSITKKTQRP